jgi:putative spermidine/putrescine transport system permease protein
MRSRIALISLGSLTILLCLFLVLPTLAVVPLSFTTTDFIIFPPRGFSWRWYEAFFIRPEWRGALTNSLIVGIFTSALATTLGTMVSLGLPQVPRWANRFLGFFFLLPVIVPSIITAVGLYGPLAKIGLIATIPGLIIAHTLLAMPFVVINVSAVVQKLDWRIVHAARSLGASPARAFFKVTLPALAPGVGAGAAFAFLTSFDEIVIAIFISGSSATTLPVQMWNGIRFEISPIVAAASTLLLLTSCGLLAIFHLLKRKRIT